MNRAHTTFIKQTGKAFRIKFSIIFPSSNPRRQRQTTSSLFCDFLSPLERMCLSMTRLQPPYLPLPSSVPLTLSKYTLLPTSLLYHNTRLLKTLNLKKHFQIKDFNSTLKLLLFHHKIFCGNVLTQFSFQFNIFFRKM